MSRAFWPALVAGQFVLWLLLQFWRPYYFLTDDNLAQMLPVLAEAGRHLRAGGNPFISDCLFGGHYPLFRDPNFLCCWHPAHLLLATLWVSPLPLGLMDVIAGFHLLLAAAGFSSLLFALRKQGHLAASDLRVLFLTLSYVNCGYALFLGASWFNHLPVLALLPWLGCGFIERKPRRGTIIISLAVLHALLSSHLQPLLYALLTAGILAVIHDLVRCRWHWLRRLAMGATGALVIGSPALIPALIGFSQTARDQALTLDLTAGRLTVPWLLKSFLAGNFGALAGPPAVLFNAAAAHPCLLAASAANLLLFVRPRLAKISGIHVLTLIGLALSLLFVLQPDGFSILLKHTPLFRSLRWPFREVCLLVFFTHLWIALRAGSAPGRIFWGGAILGTALFIGGLAWGGPPSLDPMNPDRQALLDGTATRYWEKLPPATIILCTLDDPSRLADPRLSDSTVFCLAGAYNYPALFGVVSPGGYSNTRVVPPVDGEEPLDWRGIYGPEQARRLRQTHPEMQALKLD